MKNLLTALNNFYKSLSEKIVFNQNFIPRSTKRYILKTCRSFVRSFVRNRSPLLTGHKIEPYAACLMKPPMFYDQYFTVFIFLSCCVSRNSFSSVLVALSQIR